MKKTTAFLLACLMLFALSACGGNSESVTSEAEPSEQTEITLAEKNDTLTEIQAAYLYNRAFVVASTWFSFGNPYWDTADSYMNDNGFNFAVKHETIDSISSLKKYLYNYFSENLVDPLVAQLYTEKDGKLYQFSPEAGDRLPEYRLNNTKALITSQNDDSTVCDITINMYFDDGPNSEYTREEDETVSISFIFENGNWVIDNHFSHDLYAPFTWDGMSPLTEQPSASEDNVIPSTTEEVIYYFPGEVVF